MNVRIFPIAKTTTQSGRAGIGEWCLRAELETPRTPEPLMGWVSAGDTLTEINMRFDSAEAAISFAKSKGWGYTLTEASKRRVKPRNYSDNFKYEPAEESRS